MKNKKTMSINRHRITRQQHGFTVIELLVVIAIIGLLSTLAVVSLSGARVKARDAKRMADLSTIRKAIEVYIQYNEVPPALPATWAELGDDDHLGPFLGSGVPLDPDNGTDGVFVYCVNPVNNNYLLATALSENIDIPEDIDGAVASVVGVDHYTAMTECCSSNDKTVIFVDCNDSNNGDIAIANSPSFYYRSVFCIGKKKYQ
ncbi:type II secretion system GspH family protein [Patescibacteria group bacterium]|nr:type II secretion system GspH family protein [Patescibacteria group bacterium]